MDRPARPSVTPATRTRGLESGEVLTLRDGRRVRVRAVRANDEPAILDFLEDLSPTSRRRRFFTVALDLRRAAHWAGAADGTDHFGLLAHDACHVIGHAAYVRAYGPRAEVAVEVPDELHRDGLATLLLICLARVAQEHGIRRFVAEVLTDNGDMLAAFRDGFDASVRLGDDGVIEVEFPTSAWQLARGSFEAPAN